MEFPSHPLEKVWGRLAVNWDVEYYFLVAQNRSNYEVFSAGNMAIFMSDI